MEWLTTSEILEKLHIGDIAEPDDNNEFERITRNNKGSIVWCHDTDKCVPLNTAVLNTKWHIFPREVSFEEAKAALQSGRIIQCEMPISNRVTRYFNNHDVISYGGDALTWDQIFKGKWTIDN